MTDNIILDQEAIDTDSDWARLFNYRVNKDLLRFCIYSISLNDPAHNLGHVFDVCELGTHLCEKMGLDDRTSLQVYLGCLLHDIGCKYDRKTHHLIGYGLTYELLSRYCPGDFTPEETKDIALAVLEHRSSNPNKPSNLVSSLVSIADSGVPSFEKYVKRAIQFRMKDDLSLSTMKENVKHHLLDKFGVQGYHWKSYPDVGMELFKDEWSIFSEKLYSEQIFDNTITEIFKSLKE